MENAVGKNCFECKYANIKFKEDVKNNNSDYVLITADENSILGDMYGICYKNNTEKLINFYKRYGISRPKNMANNVNFDCHEYSDGVKMLNKCIENADKLLNQLTRGD